MGNHSRCLQWAAVLTALAMWVALPAAALDIEEVRRGFDELGPGEIA